VSDGDTLTACALGTVSYAAGVRLQEALVVARAAGLTGDWLLYPEHPSVVTAGRGAHADSLKVDRATLARLGVEYHESSRGGDVTWHGPGQVVGYPICDLTRRDRDLHRFLRDLEQALIEALAGWGISAQRSPGRTGVWVGDEKIASIGIAVRRWVSYHGFALNVAAGLPGFDLIHPCGLRGIRMTSVVDQLGRAAPAPARVRSDVAAALAVRLGHSRVAWAPPAEVRAAAEAPCHARPAAASKPPDGHDARPRATHSRNAPC